ncbi:MAG: DUF1073 domain-containing protein [Desulfovibrionaceae bacterium]
MTVDSKKMYISSSVREQMAHSQQPMTMEQIRATFGPARTLGQPDAVHVAMDAALEECGAYGLMQHTFQMGNMLGAGTTGFLGYAYLSMLAQNGLIRAGVETVADEMTRKWVEIKGADTEDDTNIKTLTRELERFKLQAVFNDAAAKTQYFGGCLVYIDTGDLDAVTARTPLSLDTATLALGSLRRFTVVEPINIYPGHYNASDPLSPEYFNPQTWWVLGKEYHKSRFLYFTANEVPLLLKPSYNFFGIPMTQLALDYVGHFTETREAAARLLTKFSLTAFKTNLSGILNGGGTSDLDARIQYFLQKQSNDGCFVIDKETEDLVKLDTSLAGTIDIVRQSLELLSAIFRVPAVKLLGISPAGFNATGEGDLRNYYDYTASQQQKILRQPLNRTLDILQHNAFGQVDQTISVDFVRPGDDDPKYISDMNKVRADTDAVLLDRGIISQEEVRARIAADPASGYSGIDVDNVPEQAGAGMSDPMNDADEAGKVW